MKLYKLEAIDYNWDEYTGFIVYANNPDEAWELIRPEIEDQSYNYRKNWTITECPPSDNPEIVYKDFFNG